MHVSLEFIAAQRIFHTNSSSGLNTELRLEYGNFQLVDRVGGAHCGDSELILIGSTGGVKAVL